MSAEAAHRVLVLGGGFGGVAVAQHLGRWFADRPDVEVTLVSRENFHVFVPMLPEVAGGSLEGTHILNPVRRLCPGVTFRQETVQAIDLKRRQVTTTYGTHYREHVLDYDYLILALGNMTDLAGLPGLAQHGLPVKTMADALYLRNHVLGLLEQADVEWDADTRRRLLTLVVAGGGFAGVEVAAQLLDLVREASKSYRRVGADQARVVLLHGGERLLPELSADLAEYATQHLRRRGMEVWLQTRLAAATAESAILNAGQQISTHTLVCCVGAAISPALSVLSAEKERGRLLTDEALRLPGWANVWAVGDCAAAPNPATGQPCPPTAQFAIRQGQTVAQNVRAAILRRPQRPFSYKQAGMLVALGRRTAVGEVKGLKFSGLLAWMMWRGFYAMRLPGLERKLRVFLDWNLDLLFGRDIVQLSLERTQRLAMAHYEPGQYVLRQGEVADSFYVIANGEVEVVREERQSEETIARLGRGEYFGEMALLQRALRNASVRCLTPVDVLVIDREDFRALAGHWGELLEDLQREAARRAAVVKREEELVRKPPAHS